MFSLLLDELENVLIVKRDVKLFKKGQILIPKGSTLVMFLLILNVTNNGSELRMAVRECSVTFLPTEVSRHPSIFVDEI